MTISYNWLCEYLPVVIAPEQLAVILTSLGLEVENIEQQEEVKGGLKDLVIGEVLKTEIHPNADKLRITLVDTGGEQPLEIICGAPNVAPGQKVVVAPVGATIYPVNGSPVTIKIATIRGIKSHGMICAEDEVGLGHAHDGIMVLKEEAQPGTPAADYFQLQNDWIYEIGLTPNRMDAMSHLGVARDVCSYLTVHRTGEFAVKFPYNQPFNKDHQGKPIEVIIENPKACERYSGVRIDNVTIKESPEWLQKRIRSVGLRPINNIVDITNFILHETGQPLHAFDAEKINKETVIVRNLPEGTSFITLDEKERKLHADDLMICSGDGEPMCFGGVFGGLNSGVTNTTKHIFLESAWFNPVNIRKTSFRHNLRTDAAARFEKGTDISNTVTVLKRAALLIEKLTNGQIASDIIDVYPSPKEKKQITLTWQYLKKLSGKYYQPESVKKILISSGFEILEEDGEKIRVKAPYSKPDIELPADIVEEIMRIDGYDNVVIPNQIVISPSVETIGFQLALKEKTGNFLAANGFNEIFTNSITNNAYFNDDVLQGTVKMLNSLSAGLNILRPSMLETGLECIIHNLNRKNNNLQLFEFGKTYHTYGPGKYEEKEKLCLYLTGLTREASWKSKENKSDFFYLKGLTQSLLSVAGIRGYRMQPVSAEHFQYGLQAKIENDNLMTLGLTASSITKRFDIKQRVWYAELEWEKICLHALHQKQGYSEIPRFPAVQRDLAIIVDKEMPYDTVELMLRKSGLKKLQSVSLFDVFESDKLGKGKKSFAISFTFLDREKTLTDQETDEMMQKIMYIFEQKLQAEIRK